MGFLKNGQLEQGGAGIKYIEGSPTVIKSDSKHGEFKQLSQRFGSDEMTVHLLKDTLIGKLVLYPFQDVKKKNEYRQLFFIDCETNEVCTTLLKTYNEGAFKSLSAEIHAYNRNNDTDKDYTDFEIVMKFNDISATTPMGKFAIEFYFCKDNDGDACKYMILSKKGIEVNKKANVQFLSKEDFARNEEFYNETNFGDDLYDARLMDEVFKQNYDKAQFPENKHDAVKMALLYSLGIVSEQKALRLASKVGGDQITLSEPIGEKILALA